MKSMDNQNSNLQTQTVAQKLLAQVKPSILKIIQGKIETIVQELCDEGVFDEKTILNVLEQRASQIFPEKYMRQDSQESLVKICDVDFNSQSDQQDLPKQALSTQDLKTEQMNLSREQQLRTQQLF